jgi:predicted nucleotidyltransferase
MRRLEDRARCGWWPGFPSSPQEPLARLVTLFGSAVGSVARGDATAASDVDLLVEFEPGRSLLDQVHLIADLEALLGRRVDVVAEGGLLDRDGHILAEAVPL